MTSHTPALKLECLNYMLLLCHTCQDEKKLKTVVFLKDSLSETPCSKTISRDACMFPPMKKCYILKENTIGSRI